MTRARSIAAGTVLLVLSSVPAGVAAAGAAPLPDPVTVSVGQNPNAVAVDPGTHTAYVLNSGNGQAEHGNGTLSVVTGTSVTTTPVGGTPVSVAVDTATHTVYVAVYNTTSHLLEISAGGTRRIAVTDPIAVAVDSSDGTVWLLEAGRRLVEIAGRTQTTYGPLRGDLPIFLALDSRHDIPYVLSVDGTLTEVSNGVSTVKHLGPAAAAITVDNRTGTVLVAHSSYVAGGLLHPALLSEVSGIQLHLVDLGDQEVGGLAVDQSTGTPAVSEYESADLGYGRLARIRGSHVRQATVGGTPGAVAIDSADGAACVVNHFSGTASVVQGTTVQTVTTGADPVAAATDDSAGLCYVANLRDGTVAEIPLP